MDYGDKKPSMPHQLILQDRSQLELTGVSDVDNFDETTVTAYTSLGELTVHGKALHIRRLDLEGGLLSLEGQVDTLSYSNTVRRSGFLGRLFR